MAAFFFAFALIRWNTFQMVKAPRSQGKDTAITLQSPDDDPLPPDGDHALASAPIPKIEIKPSKMMHDFLTALSGGTMGKNPTAVATFLLTREIQRLIESKHIRGDWF